MSLAGFRHLIDILWYLYGDKFCRTLHLIEVLHQS